MMYSLTPEPRDLCSPADFHAG